MVTITCTQNERGMLLRELENLKEYRNEEYKNGEINELRLEYELETLDRLIARVKGIYYEDYMMNSKVFKDKQEKTKSKESKEFDIDPEKELKRTLI